MDLKRRFFIGLSGGLVAMLVVGAFAGHRRHRSGVNITRTFLEDPTVFGCDAGMAMVSMAVNAPGQCVSLGAIGGVPDGSIGPQSLSDMYLSQTKGGTVDASVAFTNGCAVGGNLTVGGTETVTGVLTCSAGAVGCGGTPSIADGGITPNLLSDQYLSQTKGGTVDAGVAFTNSITVGVNAIIGGTCSAAAISSSGNIQSTGGSVLCAVGAANGWDNAGNAYCFETGGNVQCQAAGLTPGGFTFNPNEGASGIGNFTVNLADGGTAVFTNGGLQLTGGFCIALNGSQTCGGAGTGTMFYANGVVNVPVGVETGGSLDLGYNNGTGSLTNSGSGNGGNVTLTCQSATKIVQITNGQGLQFLGDAGTRIITPPAEDMHVTVEDGGRFEIDGIGAGEWICDQNGATTQAGSAVISSGSTCAAEIFGGATGATYQSTSGSLTLEAATAGNAVCWPDGRINFVGPVMGNPTLTVEGQPGDAGSGATSGSAGSALTVQGGPGGPGGTTGNAAVGGTATFQGGPGGTAGSSTGSAGTGGTAIFSGGTGGAGNGVQGGAGGITIFQGGPGGAGTASQAAGAGNVTTLRGGAAGANNGGGGNNGGSLNVQGGLGSGAGTNGGLNLGIAQTGTVAIGTSTTTIPVQIAGGSGVFVGSCAMSASTSCTATVPTGAKCICYPQTAVAVGTNNPFGVVSSTTMTCNSGGTSNSATWTIICL